MDKNYSLNKKAVVPQDFDTAYYLSLSSTERVENVQFLREEFFKSHGLKFCEDGKRLRRVFRIIKQA